uniref:RAS and EF-hand domain containing n=1 Tax=Xiphophorus couchianus TaxID=32473 RepID=A0A3B5LAC8_9TELE
MRLILALLHCGIRTSIVTVVVFSKRTHLSSSSQSLAATLYQNISLTEPRLIPQFEKVILNFAKEIKQQNSDMENLALAIKRAQDQASMQLGEMEEEMEQRIQAAERKTHEQVGHDQIHFGSFMMQRLFCSSFFFFDLLPIYYNLFLQENQKLKQELLKSQTKVACLQSEMDGLKTELTDQSMNSERDEELMKHFADERDILESQIEILQTANRKLHDSNDGLRSTLEKITRVKTLKMPPISPVNLMLGQRLDDFPLYPRRPSCDTLALAICDPGLRRRHSSECEEDSLPEIYVDSGMSTLRGSHGGYDWELTLIYGSRSKGQWVVGWMTRVTCNGYSDVYSAPLSPLQNDDKENADLGYMTSEKAYRIVLAGDVAVGKSSFLLRLCKNEFKLNSSTTLGVDFQMKTLIVDGEPVLLQLWDTAGQERFRSIAKSYFRRADGVLLLYDVNCEKTFLNVRDWVDMIEDMAHDDIPIMLVGNKCDLRQDGDKSVPTSYGQKLAMTYNTLFCETSAKDGSNILEAVLHLARHPPVSSASGGRSKRSCLKNYNICWGFCTLCVRAGTDPCLHLPSVYIVRCLMRRDHSFVKQHVG